MEADIEVPAAPTGPWPTDRDSLERDCDVEFTRAGGPGGQHRNKTETAVRLTHRPSGLAVLATERRSQSQNREVAYARLAAKLDHLQKPKKPRRPTRVGKGALRRREQARRHQSEKKAGRRGGWSGD